MKYRNFASGEDMFLLKAKHLLSAPFILSIIVPLVIVDLWVEIYHRVCFPLFGIPYISRKKYFAIDRHKLKKLRPLEKLFCMYCGYANGWCAYASKIAAKTEKYWCAIKHKAGTSFLEPEHQKHFVERDKYR